MRAGASALAFGRVCVGSVSEARATWGVSSGVVLPLVNHEKHKKHERNFDFMRDVLSKACPFCAAFPVVIEVDRPGKRRAFRAECSNEFCKATFGRGSMTYDAALNHWDRRPVHGSAAPEIVCPECDGLGRKKLSGDHLKLLRIFQEDPARRFSTDDLHPSFRGLAVGGLNKRLGHLEALGLIRRLRKDGRSFLWECSMKEKEGGE